MTKLHSIIIQDTAVLILTAESIASLVLLPSHHRLFYPAVLRTVLKLLSLGINSGFFFGGEGGSFIVRTSVLKIIPCLFGLHTLGLTKVTFNYLRVKREKPTRCN